MTLRFQYCSDIHLESNPTSFRKILTPNGDILILAGDIGLPQEAIYGKFLRWCSNRWRWVILVPGNHEYHGMDYEQGKILLETICKDAGVILLDKKEYVIPGTNIVLLGATLWTEIHPDHVYQVLTTISDYSCIKDWDVNQVNTLHREEKQWLKETLKKYTKCVRLVITHHAPLKTITSAPIYRNKENNCAFASNCSDVILEGKPALWFYGHTHYNTIFRYGETVVASNPRGYEKEQLRYNSQAFFDFHVLSSDGDTPEERRL